MRITQVDTDLGRSQALLCELAHVLDHLRRALLEPRRRCSSVWQGRLRDALPDRRERETEARSIHNLQYTAAGGKVACRNWLERKTTGTHVYSSLHRGIFSCSSSNMLTVGQEPQRTPCCAYDPWLVVVRSASATAVTSVNKQPRAAQQGEEIIAAQCNKQNTVRIRENSTAEKLTRPVAQLSSRLPLSCWEAAARAREGQLTEHSTVKGSVVHETRGG